MIKMKLSEMINYINSNSKTISLEDLEDHGTYLFKRLTYAISDYEAEQCALAFVIKDRGLETEQAYIKGTFPNYLKPPSFKDEIETQINSIMANNPSIEGYRINFIDEQREIAEIIGYFYNADLGKTNEKRYVVIKIENTFHFRELV